MIAEINFDGLIGPTHNYAALSFGNLASASNAGAVSRPRDAALQDIGDDRWTLNSTTPFRGSAEADIAS